MELELPYFTLFLTFFFLFFVTTILKNTKANKLPPGPWKLPPIGNMHQLVTSLTYHTLRGLAKKHGPLMHLQLGDVSTIVISSAEVAKEVMKTNDTIFSHRDYNLAMDIMSYNFKAVVFTPYGNYWRQMRKICTMELFSPNRVQSFQSVREEEVSDFIQSILLNEGPSINLSEKIFSLAYGITARTTFGKKPEGQEEIIRIVSKILDLSSGFHLADMYPSSKILSRFSTLKIEVEKLHKDSDNFLEKIVIEHKDCRKRMKQTDSDEHVENNLVDVLLKIREQPGDLEFPLTNDHIKAVIQDIFAARSESSAITIEWPMSELLKHPKLMKKAQNEVRRVFGENGKVNEERVHELKFFRSIVKETLRLHPPNILILRECRENCVINGYEIRAKFKVLINLWAIGRDPSYWKDAEEFRPERFLESSVDFSW